MGLPYKLQPVEKDVSYIDQTVNGLFSLDEFMKGKHALSICLPKKM